MLLRSSSRGNSQRSFDSAALRSGETPEEECRRQADYEHVDSDLDEVARERMARFRGRQRQNHQVHDREDNQPIDHSWDNGLTPEESEAAARGVKGCDHGKRDHEMQSETERGRRGPTFERLRSDKTAGHELEEPGYGRSS